jgi:FkbH-like protein
MFEFDYGTDLIAGPRAQGPTSEKSCIEISEIQSLMFMRWEEHCLECSAPDCFRSCPLHVQRMDRMCARFVDGINPNPRYSGPFNYGADISFRRWGKLIASITNKSLDPISMRRLCETEFKVVRAVSSINSRCHKFVPSRKLNLNLLYNRIRKLWLDRKLRAAASADTSFDEFLVEVHNLEKEEITILLEVSDSGKIYSKHSIVLSPGPNLRRIPWNAMKVPNAGSSGEDPTIKLYPENNETPRIVVTFLYPVKWTTALPSDGRSPAEKVKCVIWDLDDTVWDGVLAENEEESIKLRPHVYTAIQELDRRGILQSIASKNDYQPAWSLLNRFSLEKYFVFPEINWGPKSNSIANIAENLNIHPNTFAFIDDSAFERTEVASKYPEVRIFDNHSVSSLLSRAEFQVPVTLESSRRREMYQQEEKRVKDRPSYGDDYDAFLRSCELRARIFVPSSDMDIARCAELLQRTNQLNTSGRRFNAEALRELAMRDDIFVGSFHCKDRFGEYGIVGVFIVQLDARTAVVTDFVVSCRVTRKGVEPAIFEWLRGKLFRHEFDTLTLAFSPTKRNKVMLDVLLELGFRGEVAQEASELSLQLDTSVLRSDLVRVEDDTSEKWQTPQLVTG